MVNKKAASHVEIIFAFVIFVGFVFFLLYFIQPAKTDTLQEATLISLKNNFFEMSSVNLTTVLVNFSANGNNPCRLSSSFVPNTTDMGVISISTSKNGFYYLYYSNAPNMPTMANCPNGNYSLGNINNLFVTSDSKLVDIENKYKTDYESLKSELGLIAGVDFSVLSENYSLDKKTPDQTKVIAGSYRKQVFYANGTLINKDFIVKVW
jgi:hypothetical protein